MPAAIWRAIWRSIRRCSSTATRRRSKTAPRIRSSIPNEDPFIRQKFEEELGKRGIKSIMPDECYKNPDYEWSKAMGKQ